MCPKFTPLQPFASAKSQPLPSRGPFTLPAYSSDQQEEEQDFLMEETAVFRRGQGASERIPMHRLAAVCVDSVPERSAEAHSSPLLLFALTGGNENSTANE